MKLKLGTRGSALALVQASWVETRLRELNPGLEVERVVITTSGDRFSQQGGQGGAFDKGLFVKEIEEALLDGRVDLGVHSSKDLPAELPEALHIGAFPERESPRDVLIARGGGGLSGLPQGARIGSASLRRQVQLRMLRPDLVPVELRGNVDTRLRKLAAGECDALVLAEAGLKRLGKSVDGEVIDIVAAPGQGALALECRKDDAATNALLAPLDDRKTRVEVEAERAFLQAMGGSCRMPLGALGELDGNWLRLSVFWSDMEGRRPVKLTARTKTEPAKIAEAVSRLVENIKQAAASS